MPRWEGRERERQLEKLALLLISEQCSVSGMRCIIVQSGENIVKKLIAKYMKSPTAANANRVASYYVKHPFSTIMLTNVELAALMEALKRG